MNFKDKNSFRLRPTPESDPQIGSHDRKLRLYDILMMTLVIFSGALSYFILDRSITEASQLLVLTSFSVHIIIYLIFALTACKLKPIYIALTLSFCTSLFFAFSFLHAVIIGIALLCAGYSARRIRRYLFESISVRPMAAVRTGVMPYAIALSLAICSQYFFIIKSYETSDLLARTTNLQLIPQQITKKIFQSLLPMSTSTNSFNSVETIDDFLTTLSPLNQTDSNVDTRDFQDILPAELGDQASGDLMPNQDSLEKVMDKLGVGSAGLTTQLSQSADTLANQAVIAQGQEFFTSCAGRQVSGDENLFDVLRLCASNKVASAIDTNENLASALPLAMSSVLFVILLSLASILRFIWIFGAYIFFQTLKVYGAITVVKVKKDVEVIKF